jgi:hypothetical protein
MVDHFALHDMHGQAAARSLIATDCSQSELPDD